MRERHLKRSWFLIMMMLSILCFRNVTVQAASGEEKALAAYKTALEKNYFCTQDNEEKVTANSFCLIHLNGDAIPELLVKCYLGGGWGGTKGYLVYTYQNGKVKRLAVLNGGESNTQAYYYEKAGVLREDWTRWGYTTRKFWKMTSSKVKAAFGYTKPENGTAIYYSEGKTVNKNQYNALVKAAVGKEQAVNVEKLLKANTSKNRTRYLAPAKPAVRLNKSSVTLTLGKTVSVKLKASVTGTKSKVKWSSSNKKVAVVNSSGKVTAKKAGTATITAKAGKVSAKCRITVKKKESVKTRNKKALAAYGKILQKNKFSGIYGTGLADVFYLLDINGDGVKELITRKDKVIYIYTYDGNKAVQILTRGGWGGNSLTYYKKSKVLLFYQSGSGILENTYYVMKNGKMTAAARIGINYTAEKAEYELNGKKASKASVDKYRQKLSKESAVKLEYNVFKKNTSANRKKYCK